MIKNVSTDGFPTGSHNLPFSDLDPAVVEQKEASQPACIPLSYVLKFITEASRRENQSTAPAPDVRRRLLSVPKTPSVRSSTPTGYYILN